MLLWQTHHPTKAWRQLRMDDLDTRRTAVLVGTPKRVMDTVRYAAANHGEILQKEALPREKHAGEGVRKPAEGREAILTPFCGARSPSRPEHSAYVGQMLFAACMSARSRHASPDACFWGSRCPRALSLGSQCTWGWESKPFSEASIGLGASRGGRQTEPAKSRRFGLPPRRFSKTA